MKQLNLKESKWKIKMFMALVLIVFFAFPTFQVLSAEQAPTPKELEDMGLNFFYQNEGYPGTSQVGCVVDINRTGNIRKSGVLNGCMVLISADDYRKGNYKPGQPIACFNLLYSYPPGREGTSLDFWSYGQNLPFDPKKEIYPETWGYSPATRRVTRYSAAARDDSVRGTPIFNDDTWGIKPEYETRTCIGTDIIKPEEFAACSLKEPLECWVVESKSKLPNYYLSKRILWFDKKNLLPYREEQYNKKGILWKIWERDFYPLTENPGVGNWLSGNWVVWDLSIDFRYHKWAKDRIIDLEIVKAVKLYKETGQIPYMMEPEFMRREKAWRSYTTTEQDFQKALSLPDVKLWRNKFPEHRKIELPEETLKRIKKEVGE